MKLQKLNALREKGGAFLKKWKLPLLFGAAGILLLLIPAGKKAENETAVQTPVSEASAYSLEQTERQLESILSEIDGAGRVRVMLTLSGSEERVYQQDEKRSDSESGSSREAVTVFQSAGSTEKTPVVTVTRYPVYKGALIVCDGAQSAAIKLAIVEAVSSLTGLGSDKITVIKMKHQ